MLVLPHASITIIRMLIVAIYLTAAQLAPALAGTYEDPGVAFVDLAADQNVAERAAVRARFAV